MTSDPVAIANAAAVTGTAAVTSTNVASTQLLLGGAPGTQPPPAQSTKKSLPVFRNEDDVAKAANRILQDLGFTKTKVHRFKDASGHQPTPHTDLKGCGFAAWTNSWRRIYLFDNAWKQDISTLTTGEEQLVTLWAYIVHESIHAKVFKTKWKGKHPPSYSEGFKHETETYRASGDWLANPKHPNFKALLFTQQAKDLCKALADGHREASKKMRKMLDNAPPTEPTRNGYFFAEFKNRGSIPKALVGLSPSDALEQTYGYK